MPDLGVAAAGLLKGVNVMPRVSVFSSPLLLGFEPLEQLFEQASKAGDGYPPYNIERLARNGTSGERLRITLAVAGFAADELEVTVEDRQLLVKGKQKDEGQRDFLHRGIAARSFARAFVLAEGMEVAPSQLRNGLLTIEVHRTEPQRLVRRIKIEDAE